MADELDVDAMLEAPITKNVNSVNTSLLLINTIIIYVYTCMC